MPCSYSFHRHCGNGYWYDENEEKTSIPKKTKSRATRITTIAKWTRFPTHAILRIHEHYICLNFLYLFLFAEYVSEIVILAVIVIIKKLTQRLPDPEQVVNQIVNFPQEQRRLRPRENLRRPNRYQN